MTTPAISAQDADLNRQMIEAGLLDGDQSIDTMIENLGATAADAELALPEEREVITLTADELEAVSDDLSRDELKAASYASQESTTDIKDEAEVAADAATVTGDGSPAKPARKSKSTGGTKRVARATTHGSLAAACGSLAGTPGVETIVAGLAKKVQEKAVNWYANRAVGTKLSVFTSIAIDEIGTTGKVSSKRLVELYMSPASKGGAGYSEGTARSQAQQIMTLLPAVGYAKKVGTELLPA